MLSRFSEVLQSAADVLAPPASRYVDFQYHWKLIQNFYIGDNAHTKVHIENTKIPFHLHQMLQFLVEEETENCEEMGPCLRELVSEKLGIPSCLTALAQGDQPPGLRGTVLAWYTALLRRVKLVPIHEPALHIPIQKLLVSCQNHHASPTEKEEVELLLTLCGLVRKQPKLAYLFLTKCNPDEDFIPTVTIFSSFAMKTPKRNKLFDYDCVPMPPKQISIVSQPKNPCSQNNLTKKDSTDNESTTSTIDEEQELRNIDSILDENNTFLLMDLLLSYLLSADNHIVLRACEGVMIVASLPDDKIAHLVVSTNLVSECLVEILIDKYKALPPETDTCDIDQLNITWGYASQEFADRCTKSIGLRETTAFLSWLDYCDTLAKECHVILAMCLARTLRWHFLAAELELGLAGRQHAVLVTAVVGKCLKSIDSVELLNEVSRWLVGDCGNITVRPASPVLQTLIDNCFDGGVHLCLETLRLFETMLEKASEHILHCLVLGFLEGRGYHCPPRQSYHPEDEERDRLNAQSLQHERESNRQTMKRVCEGRIDDTLANWPQGNPQAPSGSNPMSLNNIHKVINSFLLLLPRNLLSDPAGVGYEQYMQDAHRHYLSWVEATSSFNWPAEAVWNDPTTSSTHSCDSRPEADLHNNCSPCRVYEKYKNPPEMISVGVSADLTNKNEDHNDEPVFSDDNVSIDANESNVLKNNSNSKPEQVTEEAIQEQIENRAKIKVEDIKASMDKTEIDKETVGLEHDHLSCVFHQQLVLSQKDRCSLSEMAQDDEMTFDEGPFIRTLYKLLLNMPNQPYQINLQLTAIFSKLAMMPHPYLHEYLLNPVLPTGKNVNTLFKTLQKLAKVFLSQIPKVKNFNSIIEQTRQRLLGDSFGEESDKNDPLFESLIVVEEFCKELAAISFVKYHHSCQQAGI